MTRAAWLLIVALPCGCRSSAPAPVSNAAASASGHVASGAPASAPPPTAAGSTSESVQPEFDEFAKHGPAALVSECIQRGWLGYTCNNAYAAAARRFPADAEAIRTLMRLAVRVDAGKPYGGEAEVTTFCVPERGEGGAYACLYLAEGNPTPEGKAAHAFACKGARPEGQVPVAGGSAACDGERPVQIARLPGREAEQVERCFACGFDASLSGHELESITPSAKACVAIRKRLAHREAVFVERMIEPLCPPGS